MCLLLLILVCIHQVLNECVEAEGWLREKQQQQESLPKHSTPAILSADVRKKAEVLDRYSLVLNFFDRKCHEGSYPIGFQLLGF